MTENDKVVTKTLPDRVVETVNLQTVDKKSVEQIFEYFHTEPYGEVAPLVNTLAQLYAAYRNNTGIVLSLQPGGEVSIDDI